MWRRGWDSNPCAVSDKLISSHAKYNDHERKWRKLSEDNGTSKPFERAVFLVALSQKPWKEKGFEPLPKTA